MKISHRQFLLLILLSTLLLPAIRAEASWLIDGSRFHMSVHGRLSCLDCHDGITPSHHPLPSDADKTLSAFFSPDQCAACHDSLNDYVARGGHGGRKVTRPEDIYNCIGCHDPHYQSSLAESAVKPGADARSKPACARCHENRASLPALPKDDEACMTCHRQPESDKAKDSKDLAAMCLHCHGESAGAVMKDAGTALPLVRPPDPETSHGQWSCLACHPKAPFFPHDIQGGVECLSCHVRHDEKVAHDAHLDVECQACHLKDAVPFKNPGTGKVSFRIEQNKNSVATVHQLADLAGTRSCTRCHREGNGVGASAAVLPPKSVICMPCHAATLSASDPITIAALFFFLVGILSMVGVWMTGARSEKHSGKKTAAGTVIKAVVLDGLLQRRLFRRSRQRWLVHALIFWSFAFRFAWGIIALTASLTSPARSLAWSMLDRNGPAGGFLFDLTGLFMLAAVVILLVRSLKNAGDQPKGLPAKDWLALGLLAGMVVTGFIVEGMRISMTGQPAGSAYAFIGYGLSLLLNARGLTGAYGIFWYFHAVTVGLFVAYLPFSRLIHMFTTPIAMALNAAFGDHDNR